MKNGGMIGTCCQKHATAKIIGGGVAVTSLILTKLTALPQEWKRIVGRREVRDLDEKY